MISLERFSLKSACFSVKHCYEVEIDFVMSSTIMRANLELAMLFYIYTLIKLFFFMDISLNSLSRKIIYTKRDQSYVFLFSG